MNKPIETFCWAQTCSAAQRTRDLVALPRLRWSGTGAVRPFLAMNPAHQPIVL